MRRRAQLGALALTLTALSGCVLPPRRCRLSRGFRQLARRKGIQPLPKNPFVNAPPTKERRYSLLLNVKEKHGIARLGLM